MRRVSIQKVVRDESLNLVSLGKAYLGLEPSKPAPGKEYVVFHDSGRILRTSYVVKVMDGLFETHNSVYKLKVLEEEPFDLTGGEPPQKTREIEMRQVAAAEN